jgi:ribosome-binding factor A
MRPYTRADRVGEQIKQALSALLLKQISDPRLEGVTITTVKVAPDLKSAKIYFVTLGSKRSHTETAAGFTSAMGFVKRSLARELKLRFMPQLTFFHDDSFDYGSHIDNLIASLKSQNGPDHSTTEK